MEDLVRCECCDRLVPENEVESIMIKKKDRMVEEFWCEDCREDLRVSVTGY